MPEWNEKKIEKTIQGAILVCFALFILYAAISNWDQVVLVFLVIISLLAAIPLPIWYGIGIYLLFYLMFAGTKAVLKEFIDARIKLAMEDRVAFTQDSLFKMIEKEHDWARKHPKKN